MAETDEPRPTPAQVNAAQNADRLRRIEEISRGVDGRRSGDLEDVQGENVVGKFQGGEFEDTPEAREARAAQEEREAAIALQEAADRAAGQESGGEGDEEAQRRAAAEAIQHAQDEAEGRARGLQEEGAAGGEGEGGEPAADAARRPAGDAEEGDSKLIDGVRYYATPVNGEMRWLTLKQLRESATNGLASEETLQRAREALQRATEAELSPKPAPAPALSDEELRQVILAAGMGDTEAVDKLVTVIRRAPATNVDEQTVSRLVTQRIATQRALDDAERDQRDVLGNEVLAPIFRQRLASFAKEKPNTKIADAYKTVGEGVRRDFAPMLVKPNGGAPPRGVVPGSKADKKRVLVSPPHGAARAAPVESSEREPSVSSVIDEIAKGRGQDRAIRQDVGRK